MNVSLDTTPSTERKTGLSSSKQASARITVRSKFFFCGGEKFFVKGVTYGPFPPIDGVFLPPVEKVREDLSLMHEAGINTVRLYHVPPSWFLDECEKAGLKAFITIPWQQHVSFLDTKETRREIREIIRKAVSSNRGHPAVFAYAIGNEIPNGIIRWYGSQTIERFIESLIDTAREADPRALITYANYPSTEYILPTSVDFYCYNVYLHKQSEVQKYLARLQNLAGEKPLMLGEFGMDTIRHSQEEQADLLRWHIETVGRMGLAGTVLFAWTDEWFTGGQLIEDWKFGLVDEKRKPKKAYFEIQKLFKGHIRIPLSHYPSVSVVVCSYNGARTLHSCLTSLLQVEYPDFEIILVDDGSTDETQEIMKEFPKVKNIRQKNMGLSFARNVGMEAARGEIVAYTDSDCMADKDWLYYLVGTLEQGDFTAVGGPNISPPARNWSQACVAVSPGQPSHVLITDQEAEHVPGCNMAFYKWALKSIGGFDPEYRKAGDDVDVCWRLMEQGNRIGFSPSAVVWHHRRFSVGAYFKQQEGYGEAEALLRFKHLIYFGPTGSAKWRGQVYGNLQVSSIFQRPIVYHGIFGTGLFQFIYPQRTSDFVLLMSSVEWSALTFIAALLTIQIHSIWYIPASMLACSLAVAFSYGIRAKTENKYKGFHSHLLISLLAFWQPIFRGWARYSTWMKYKSTPKQVLAQTPEGKAVKIVWDRPALLSFWSENGIGREHFLESFNKRLNQEGWKYSSDTGWTNWDYQVYGNRWWQIRLLTLTENHGGNKRLTRVRLHPYPTTSFRIVGLVCAVISLLAYLRFERGSTFAEVMAGKGVQEFDFKAIGVWFSVLCLMLALSVWKSAQLRKRVAQVTELAAKDCGLMPLHETK
jgi:O-antigen biosynthesis protein